MTIAIICVILAGFLPIVAAGIAKFGPLEQNAPDAFDNNNPRQWLARQTGLRARANAAQANSFESLPFFYVAVALAISLDAPKANLDLLAIVYLLARIAYIVCYIFDWPNSRTFVWLIGLIAIMAIFFQI
jgi:uncharacterized MAPEG superfamily protein